MFQGTRITDLTRDDIVLDFSSCTGFYCAFAYTHELRKVPFIDASKAGQMGAAFYMLYVESFHIRLSETAIFSATTFGHMAYLKNLTIEGTIGTSIGFPQSNLLTAESVQSVIDHLKDLTGQTAQTLTFHATVGGNLTAAQKAAITAKNWTLVY